MRLRILLPHKEFLDAQGVLGIVAPTLSGSLGILPRRLDFAAALAPGILEYATAGGETWIAVAEGMLVKAGDEVTAAVHDAAGGADPGRLRATVAEATRYARIGATTSAAARSADRARTGPLGGLGNCTPATGAATRCATAGGSRCSRAGEGSASRSPAPAGSTGAPTRP